MSESESFDSYKELAEYIVDAMHKLTGAEINLWTISDREGENRQYMKIVASRGNFDKEYKNNAKLHIAIDNSITALALEKGEPIIRRDIQDDCEKPKFQNIEIAKQHDWHSFMTLPLIGIDGTRLGSFSLYSREKGKFENIDIDLIKNFSRPAAIALQKQKESHTLQKLAKVGEILTQKMFSKKSNLLEIAVKEACKLLHADYAYICLYDFRGQRCERIEFGSLCDNRDKENKPCKDCPSSFEQYKEKVWLKCLTALIRQTGEIIAHNVDKGEIEIDRSTLGEPGIDHNEITGVIQQTQFIKCENIKAFVGMPLRTGKESTKTVKKEVGIFSIHFRSPHHFTQDELQMVRIFANQVANVILNKRLYDKARKQTAELKAVHETALKIVAQEDLQKLLQVIVEESVKLLQAKGGMLFLRVPNQNKVELVAVKGVPSEELKIGEDLPLGKGMVGRVVQNRKWMIVDDYSRWEGRVRRLGHLFTAMIEVPLMLGNDPIGVIVVFDDVERRTFSEKDDVPILERLAQQAALAIHNSHLLEKERNLRRQAESLRKVSSEIVSVVELHKTAETILDKLSEIAEYKRVSIQLVRGDSGELLAYRGYGRKVADKGLLRPYSLVRRVINRKAPIVINDTSKDSNWVDESDVYCDDDPKSWVGLPLIYKQEVIGLLILDHDQPGFYNENIKALLIQFAEQAAITIGNARLFDDAQRRIRELEIIQNIVGKINSSRDTKKLLKTIVSEITDQLKCSHCTLFLLAKVNHELLLVPRETYGWGKDQIMKRRFKPGEGLAGWVFQHGQSIILTDATNDYRFSKATKRTKERSMLVVPLKVGNQIIGVISADKDERGWFKENDTQTVERLARHAGIAVEQRISQDLLPEFSMQIISATEEDIILQRLVYGAIELTKTTTGIIYIIGEDVRSITKSYSYPFHFMPLSPRMDNEEGITRQVIKSGETMFFSDITKDYQVNPKLHKFFRAMLAVPLKIESKVMGVLFLHNKEPRFFPETERFLLETLSGQAAIAIRNAQLLVRIQKQHDKQIDAVQHISKSIAEPMNIMDVLNGILKWVITLMDKINYCEVSLLHKENNKMVVVAEQGVKVNKEYREIPIGYGIVGWVAQHKESQLIHDVSKDDRYLNALNGTKTGSEISVPMLKGNELVGVLNIEHPDVNAFKPKDLALAEAIAGLAAIAIENSSLYLDMESKVNERTSDLKEANEKTAAAMERLVLMNEVAAEFVHKMNNLTGTIPVRVSMALKQLDRNNSNHQPIIEQLEIIENDARNLLRISGVVRHSAGAGKPENIEINAILNGVIPEVISNIPGVEDRIRVLRNLSPGLPLIRAERYGLRDTFMSIIRNGFEAISKRGSLKISTNIVVKDEKKFLKVTVADNGKGIPKEVLPRIFDLFFTTKDKGLGFGLWRDRAFIKKLGGDIEVESVEGKGATFHVFIPVEKKDDSYD